ncbi:MAG: hypothetical protein NY202_04785 [Mollicutes bacterium UO1]
MKRSCQIRKINTYDKFLACYLDNNVYSIDKSPREKKIASFDFLKDLELGELEEDKNKKIKLLLLGKVYNELVKQNLRE